jgi:hypothetical protein
MADIDVFEKLYLEGDYLGKVDKCNKSPLTIALDVMGNLLFWGT